MQKFRTLSIENEFKHNDIADNIQITKKFHISISWSHILHLRSLTGQLESTPTKFIIEFPYITQVSYATPTLLNMVLPPNLSSNSSALLMQQFYGDIVFSVNHRTLTMKRTRNTSTAWISCRSTHTKTDPH
jgi:hypothetical protein